MKWWRRYIDWGFNNQVKRFVLELFPRRDRSTMDEHFRRFVQKVGTTYELVGQDMVHRP